jgi:hypothetical protein
LLSSFGRIRIRVYGRLQEAVTELQRVWRGAHLRLSQLHDQRAQIEEHMRRTRQAVAAIPSPNVLGRMGMMPYVLLLGVIAAADYLLFRLLFAWLPLADREIKLLCAALGIVLMGSVHVAAAHTVGLLKHEHGQTQERRERTVGLIAVATVVGAICLMIGALAIVRGDALNQISTLFDGRSGRPLTLHYGPSLWVALGLLQLLATAAAWTLALAHALGAEWRELQNELADLTAKLDANTKARTAAEAEQVELQTDLEAAPHQAQQEIEDALADHRHIEAEYLSVLSREIDEPPVAIGDWGYAPAERAPFPELDNLLQWPLLQFGEEAV